MKNIYDNKEFFEAYAQMSRSQQGLEGAEEWHQFHHHTLTQILMGLIHCGFVLEIVEEAQPSEEMLDIPGMQDEMRRPMMLMVKAVKPV